MNYYIIIALSALVGSVAQTLSTTAEVNLEYCLYEENCESCTCDLSRCLACSPHDFCECLPGMYYDWLNQTCVIHHHPPEPLICPQNPGGYGDLCHSSDDTCQFCDKDLECEHGICRCKKGTYYKRSEKKCYVYPGENCEENKNCMENSVCVEGVCKCEDNFLQDVQKCSLGYNATCHQVHKCHRGVHLECVKSVTIVSTKRRTTKTNFWKCKCIAEGEFYIWSKSLKKCVGLSGTRCDYSRDECIVNAHCNPSNSRCECNDGFANRDGRCLRKCSTNSASICGQYQFCDKDVCKCESRESTQMVYDDCGECKMPFGGLCGIESQNYTCDTGLICSKTCGSCTHPEDPPCTSSSDYCNFKFSILIILLVLSLSIHCSYGAM